MTTETHSVMAKKGEVYSRMLTVGQGCKLYTCASGDKPKAVTCTVSFGLHFHSHKVKRSDVSVKCVTMQCACVHSNVCVGVMCERTDVFKHFPHKCSHLNLKG